MESGFASLQAAPTCTAATTLCRHARHGARPWGPAGGRRHSRRRSTSHLSRQAWAAAVRGQHPRCRRRGHDRSHPCCMRSRRPHLHSGLRQSTSSQQLRSRTSSSGHLPVRSPWPHWARPADCAASSSSRGRRHAAAQAGALARQVLSSMRRGRGRGPASKPSPQVATAATSAGFQLLTTLLAQAQTTT